MKNINLTNKKILYIGPVYFMYDQYIIEKLKSRNVQSVKVQEKSGFAMNANCIIWISKIALTAGGTGVTLW